MPDYLTLIRKHPTVANNIPHFANQVLRERLVTGAISANDVVAKVVPKLKWDLGSSIARATYDAASETVMQAFRNGVLKIGFGKHHAKDVGIQFEQGATGQFALLTDVVSVGGFGGLF